MLYHLYSGNLFFSSLAVLVVLCCLDLARVARKPMTQSLFRIGILTAVSLAAFSTTPVNAWVAACGVLATA